MNSNILYFDIVGYATALCVFITVATLAMLVLLVNYTGGLAEIKSESSMLELVWTVVPTFWVIVLCAMNVGAIMSDFEGQVGNSVKVVGRQWYWSYDYDGEEYDSYMTQLVNNVDNPLKLEYGVPTRLLVTGSDVIHSFSVPDLGIKVDAIPGRINQVVYTPDRVGSFVGYCSELCGVGHSYMPIVVEVVMSSTPVEAVILAEVEATPAATTG
uniref:cytochrome c oxidase subunit 2 n=1 Tax=Dactylogyrus tuba TaxID=231340 RepID=UPI002E798993|nr:cytochrome c oxidase subunit 2 [Dactylogyrus tuba]WCF76301.1 cytochrome c oxidase subunit 2 [Dactylogyrus tuba]